MKLEEGKLKFIETWGKLAGSWGVTKSMAQMHALLLIATAASAMSGGLPSGSA